MSNAITGIKDTREIKNKTKINKNRKKSRRSSLLVDNRKTLLQTLDFSTHTALNCSSFYTDAIFLYISFETLLLSKQQSKSVESSRRSTAPLLLPIVSTKAEDTHTHTEGKRRCQSVTRPRSSLNAGRVYKAKCTRRQRELKLVRERARGRRRID